MGDSIIDIKIVLDKLQLICSNSKHVDDDSINFDSNLECEQDKHCDSGFICGNGLCFAGMDSLRYFQTCLYRIILS